MANLTSPKPIPLPLVARCKVSKREEDKKPAKRRENEKEYKREMIIPKKTNSSGII